MTRFRPIPVLLMFAVAGTACSEGPISPADDVPLHAAQMKLGPYVQMASAAGQVTLPFGQDQFALNARQSADGSVSGRQMYKSSFFDLTLRGNVVCMAWKQVAGIDVLAIGTDTPRPTFPEGAGPYGVTFLIDGGEGANASPDLIFSDFVPPQAYPGGVPDDAAGSCDAISLPPFAIGFFFEPDNGNIQVSPSSP